MTDKTDKTDGKKPASISDLARVADGAAAGRMRLFKASELANIPDTPDNRRRAVEQIQTLTSQTRELLEWSVTRRGMFLCWLKNCLSGHGEWETFCRERLPEISDRTRRYWMAAYLQAVGEKPRRELPRYEPDEMEDAELAREVEQLSGDRKRTLPRRELMDLVDRMQAQIQKGQEQAEKRERAMARLEEQLEKLTAGDYIPETVKREADRCKHIQNRYYSFVRAWLENLPADETRLQHHRSLWQELAQHMAAMWENDLYPRFEELCQEAEALPKGPR